MKKLVDNTKEVFRFVNLEDINTLVDFLDENNISYDPDLADGDHPRFVSFGTSKKYTVGTSRKFDIYTKKGFGNATFVDSINPNNLTVENLIEDYFIDNTSIQVVLDEVDLHEEEETIPSHEDITTLYQKVKKQKKSPSNYVIVSDGNGSFKATTNTSLDNFGNLKELFDSID